MASDWIWKNRTRHQVILDSSAILMLFEFAIDLEGELTRLLGIYRIVVPLAIKEELNVLATRKTSRKAQMAKAALQLIAHYPVVPTTEKTADDSVLSLALRMQGIVLTNDLELRQRAKKSGLSVIFLRGKKQLALS